MHFSLLPFLISTSSPQVPRIFFLLNYLTVNIINLSSKQFKYSLKFMTSISDLRKTLCVWNLACFFFSILSDSLINNISFSCKYFNALYPHTILAIRTQLCKYFSLQKHQIMCFQNNINLNFKKQQCFLASSFTKHRIMQTRMILDVIPSGKA